MRHAVPYLSEVSTDETPRGQLIANVRFEYRDAQGEYRGRNVRIHNEYSSTLDEAKNAVSALRKNNDGLHIQGKFTVIL
jgi:hypothetical protein